jgi:hypothetical protein
MSLLQFHGKRVADQEIPISAPELCIVPFHLPLVAPLCSHETGHRVPCVSAIHDNIQPHPMLPLQVRNHENAINRLDRINIAAGVFASGQSFLAEPWQFGRNIKKSTVFLPNSSTWQPPGLPKGT